MAYASAGSDADCYFQVAAGCSGREGRWRRFIRATWCGFRQMKEALAWGGADDGDDAHCDFGRRSWMARWWFGMEKVPEEQYKK